MPACRPRSKARPACRESTQRRPPRASRDAPCCCPFRPTDPRPGPRPGPVRTPSPRAAGSPLDTRSGTRSSFSRQRNEWARWWSRGVAEVVDCGVSGDGRKPPVQLVERALLGLELWIGSFVLSKLVALERERLDPANELGEFASLAARLELIQVAVGGHRLVPSSEEVSRSDGAGWWGSRVCGSPTWFRLRGRAPALPRRRAPSAAGCSVPGARRRWRRA